MVVKTEICHYTEYKIYPGHGQKSVGRDMRTSIFITKKAEQLYHQKIKPVKLTWTQAWRRHNKKGAVSSGARRKNKRTVKVQKAIVGLTLDDIKNKKKAVAQRSADAAEQAKIEAKKRVQNKVNKPKAAAPKAAKAQQKPVQQKNMKGAQGNKANRR